MTFTITKKDIILCSVIAILVIVLCASALVFSAGGRESNDSKITSEQQNVASSGFNTELPKLPANLPPANQPHPSCFMKLYYLSPRSATFNGNNPYNTAFMGGATNGPPISVLQDINGDNLPDYLYSLNSASGGSTQLTSVHFACVYLNNGNGWTKAYECYAATATDIQTGNVVSQEYSGDCAGTPPGKN